MIATPGVGVRSIVAALLLVLAAGPLSCPANAQLYPQPYAVETHESGTPPYVVSAGGYMAPGGRIFGPVMGLYDKSYADFATLYLIQMAAYSNACSKADYDRVRDAYQLLINEAGARVETAKREYDQAGLTNDSETWRGSPKERAAQAGIDHAKNDYASLYDFPLPPYDDCHCGQPPGTAPTPPPPPPPPPAPTPAPPPPPAVQRYPSAGGRLFGIG